MEVIRYVNGERIPGELPAMRIQNEGTVQILLELQRRFSVPDPSAPDPE